MLHTSMRVCALIMGLSFTASAATAPLLTDANEHWPPASLDATAYLGSYQDSIFHTTVTRASGTPGTAIPLVTGQTWSTRTRHTYMSQQVWSADERLLFINFGGPLLLDGETYHVIARRSVPGNHCGSWHPILPDRMLYIDETVVGWYDMRQALVLW